MKASSPMTYRILSLISILLSSILWGCGGTVSITQKVQLPAMATVTFYGDSLTAFWNLQQSFPGRPYVNAGTPSLTAVTLSANFGSAVLPTHPQGVVILAGTNDIRSGDTAANIFTTLTGMYAKAHSDGLPFVICTLPPMRDTEAFHNSVIVDLNNRLRVYAAANNIPLADYYSVLVDASGELKADLALDTIHVNTAGYALMAPLASKAITAM